MKFKPLGDRVLIKRIISESKTQKGIIIPSSSQNNSNEGIIVASGDGYTNKKGHNIPMKVNVGQKVLFAKWSGTDIKINNISYLIMKESDILGIIKQ